MSTYADEAEVEESPHEEMCEAVEDACEGMKESVEKLVKLLQRPQQALPPPVVNVAAPVIPAGPVPVVNIGKMERPKGMKVHIGERDFHGNMKDVEVIFIY